VRSGQVPSLRLRLVSDVHAAKLEGLYYEADFTGQPRRALRFSVRK
jgi:hypothetical protein